MSLPASNLKMEMQINSDKQINTDIYNKIDTFMNIFILNFFHNKLTLQKTKQYIYINQFILCSTLNKDNNTIITYLGISLTKLNNPRT